MAQNNDLWQFMRKELCRRTGCAEEDLVEVASCSQWNKSRKYNGFALKQNRRKGEMIILEDENVCYYLNQQKLQWFLPLESFIKRCRNREEHIKNADLYQQNKVKQANYRAVNDNKL